MADAAFPLLGGVHLSVLAATFGLPAVLAVTARRFPAAADPIRWFLASILTLNAIYSVWLGIVWKGGFFADSSLPMNFCDWALIACVAALVTKKQFVFEIAYFWGMAGTIQGIFTPDLRGELPVLRILTFFIAHSGIVVAMLYCTWGLKFQTKARAAVRIFGWTQIYLGAAAIVDWSVGANYGYLKAKPQGASLLDLLGAWPWYLVWMEVIALILFALFDLPFVLARARAKAVNSSPASGVAA